MWNEIRITKTLSREVLQAEYQHLHHARALELLEEARVALLARSGIPMDVLIEEGIFPVVRSIEVQYLREIKEGEVQIFCEVKERKEKELILAQKIINERGKLAVEAVVNCMFLYRATGRSGVVPSPRATE